MNQITRKRKSTDPYVRQIPESEVNILHCILLLDLDGSAWNIFIYVTDQAWGQDGWILAKFFCCVFVDRDKVGVHKNAEKEQG